MGLLAEDDWSLGNARREYGLFWGRKVLTKCGCEECGGVGAGISARFWA